MSIPPPLEDLRKAVVIVVARGVDPANGNDEVAVRGTGFFINCNGILVTSYHLIEKLGPTVHRPSIELAIHFDSTGNAVPVREIHSSPETDIMILYAPLGGREVATLRPARRRSADIRLAATPVYAAGYPAGYDFNLVPGVVTSWNGPINPLIPSWTTDHAFSDGQSGSPIVLADSRVVAVARSSDLDNAARGIVVPIDFIPSHYWDEPGTGPEALSRAAPVEKGGQVSEIVVVARPDTER